MGRIPEMRSRPPIRTADTVNQNRALDPLREAQQVQNMIQTASNTYQEIDLHIKRESDKTFLVENEAKLKQQRLDEFAKFEEEHRGKEITDDEINDFVSKQQTKVQEFSSNLKLPQSRQSFERMANNQLVSTKEQLRSLKIRNTQDNVLASNDSTLNVLTDGSLKDSSTANALDSLKQLDTLKLSNIGTLGQKNSEALHQRQQESVASSFIDANLTKNDIPGAEALLKEDRIKEALGPKGLLSAQRKIQVLKNQNEARQERIRNKISKDPWLKYDYFSGTKAAFSPITLIPDQDTGGNTLKNELSLRSAVIADAKAKYNIDLPFFRKEEAEAVVKVFDTGRPRDTQMLLEHLSTHATDEQLESLSLQIAESNGRVGLAGALGVAVEAPQDALEIINGERLIRESKMSQRTGKATMTLPSKSQFTQAFDSYISNSITDPRQRVFVRESAYNHYLSKMFKEGNIQTDIDENVLQASVDSLIGEPIEYNDQSFASFRATDKKGRTRFLDVDDFEDMIDSFTDDRLLDFNGSKPFTRYGEEVNIGKDPSRVSLRSDKYGTYNVYVDNQILFNQQGDPYTVNMLEYYKRFISQPEDVTGPDLEDRLPGMKPGGF